MGPAVQSGRLNSLGRGFGAGYEAQSDSPIVPPDVCLVQPTDFPAVFPASGIASLTHVELPPYPNSNKHSASGVLVAGG